jgi:aminoglycoside phosphotransferase (APT) family kinase protein
VESAELSAAIVDIQRQARFAGVSSETWAQRLEALIRAQPDGGEDVCVSNVRPVGTAAGGSNGTMLFDATRLVGGGRITRNLVLRFLPTEGLFHRYDVRGQFELQRALGPTDVPVPPQVWLDADGTYLERPGYVMEQVPGTSTPMAWMSTGIVADASPADRRAMAIGYVESLAKIHGVDWEGLGLRWLEGRGSGTRPIEREVNWYWDALVWSDMGDYIALLAPVRTWLIEHEPDDVKVVLCHGDANFGNYMYVGTQVTAVVDWEMAFLGTPECDVTFTETGDLVLQPDVERPEGFLSADEIRMEYERITGHPLRNLEYFRLFTAFRIAVINVLAMKHFPADVLAAFMPTLERGPRICLERAGALGVMVPIANHSSTPDRTETR